MCSTPYRVLGMKTGASQRAYSMIENVRMNINMCWTELYWSSANSDLLLSCVSTVGAWWSGRRGQAVWKASGGTNGLTLHRREGVQGEAGWWMCAASWRAEYGVRGPRVADAQAEVWQCKQHASWGSKSPELGGAVAAALPRWGRRRGLDLDGGRGIKDILREKPLEVTDQVWEKWKGWRQSPCSHSWV